MTTSVRLATLADAQTFGRFAASDGYPITELQARARLENLAKNTYGAVFVAEVHTELAGWLHIHPVPLLASDGYAEIGGFVVADRFRRCGVGRALFHGAVAWTRAQGFSRIRLYSGMHRTAAHAFYRAVGFDGSRAPAFTYYLP